MIRKACTDDMCTPFWLPLLSQGVCVALHVRACCAQAALIKQSQELDATRKMKILDINVDSKNEGKHLTFPSDIVM